MNDIELSHLRYFVAVAEELHFGRAALRLAISQPPLTQQIQRLEERVGYALFERSTRRTSLTEAGEAMLPLARAAIEQTAQAVEAARRAGRGDTGTLIVGTPPSVMLAGLPKVIRAFRRAVPDVDLQLREMSTAAIIDALHSGTVDIGFLRSPATPDGLRELFRFPEGVSAILPQRHRLAATPRFRLAHLAREAFVFFPRRLGTDFHDELLQICEREGFAPRVVQEATQWSTIVALVEGGLGVSIGPASVARLGGRGVVIRELPGVTTSVLLAAKPGRMKPQAERFACITAASKLSMSPSRLR